MIHLQTSKLNTSLTKPVSYTVSSPILVFTAKQNEGYKDIFNEMIDQPPSSSHSFLSKTDGIFGIMISRHLRPPRRLTYRAQPQQAHSLLHSRQYSRQAQLTSS